MKRFVGLVVALSLVPAGTAAATGTGGRPGHQGEPVRGQGRRARASRSSLTQHGLSTRDIDEERFGIPEAGFPIVRGRAGARVAQPAPDRVRERDLPVRRPACSRRSTRASVTRPRPLPYPPTFGIAFPNIFTFVGTLDAVVTNEAGEQFRLLMSDLAHEELIDEVTSPRRTRSTPSSSTARGRVRDRASLVGRVKVDRATGEAQHNIVDEGTCHQTATRLGQPGVTVFGPFFVLPFPTTVVRR